MDSPNNSTLLGADEQGARPLAAEPVAQERTPLSEGQDSDPASPSIHWLSPGRIPLGQVTMLDGDPGLGKSCVALDVAARLTRGQAMPFAEAAALPPADAVILSGEDAPALVLARVAAAGGDCRRIHIVRPSLDDLFGAPPQAASDERMRLPRDLARLRDLLCRTGARLAIIDPFVAFLDPSVHWHLDQSIRRVLLALGQIAEELGVAMVLIRHLNKQSHVKAIYRGSGSIALIGNARAGLLVVEDPERADARLLVAQKSNLGPMPPAARYLLCSAGASVRVAWLDEQRLDAAGLQCAAALPEESHAIAEAVAFLKENLRDGAMGAKYVIHDAKIAGISERTLRRAKYKLGVISSVWPYGGGGDDRWQWELPNSNEPRQREE